VPKAIHTLVAEAEKEFGPAGAASLAGRVRARTARLRTLRESPTALDLAAGCDPDVIRTPALELLNDRLHHAVNQPGGRLVVSIPPQEGKTSLLRWVCARKLLDAPDTRLVYVSYSSGLARTSGRVVRGLVTTHGQQWGISVSGDHADASDWELEHHRGGMLTAGRDGSITGRPAEGVIVDDPLKNRKEADSPVILASLHQLWESVLRPRLAPGAWVVIVQTRWTEHDLAGRFADEGWPVVNIPALADGHAPDALNRPPGTYLISARGRSEADWVKTRTDIGEREWAALYQGMPAPPSGDVFHEEWFNRDRVDTRPPGSPPIVVIDPADNTGGGDEAGIIVASTDARERIYLGPDYSDHYTVGRWVRVALLAAARHTAAGLVFEQSLSGLPRSIRGGWEQLRKQALVLRRLGATGTVIDPDIVERAVTELAHPNDPGTTWETYRQELVELWPLTGAVLTFTPDGPMIRRITPKGSKEWRAQAASPSYEQRRVSHVGKLQQLEHQMVVWRPGQKSPDRLDAAVHAILLLSGASTAELVTQDKSRELPTRSTRGDGRPRSSVIPRSTLTRR
jgi:hypothetical protein